MSAGNSERIARNFVERYGAQRFRQLLDQLQAGVSGQTIADDFAVSRERVRQWKNAFGSLVTMYQVHPDVRAILDEVARGRG